jgi:hypothetical protein
MQGNHWGSKKFAYGGVCAYAVTVSISSKALVPGVTLIGKVQPSLSP